MVVVFQGEEFATGISWVKARDAATHPAMHSTLSRTKNVPIVTGWSYLSLDICMGVRARLLTLHSFILFAIERTL